MWVLLRVRDGKFVVKSEITQMTGERYTTSVKRARKYNSKEEAVVDSCKESEIPIHIDPYEYFK